MADRNFPAAYWDPQTAEQRVFYSTEEVPAGWLTHHPGNNPAPAPKPAKLAPAAKATLPMTHDEIVAALDAGNVPYQHHAADADLYKLLLNSLRAHLAEEGIKYPPKANALELLALVPPVTE